MSLRLGSGGGQPGRLTSAILSLLSELQPGSTVTRLRWVPSYDELIAEGAAMPTEGWDFAWFEGRATEERPPWGYARILGERMAALAAVPGAAALDLQTGGGEVLASVPAAPSALVATECWPPNIEVARRTLAALGARIVPMAAENDDLPFLDGAFDLITSRHPVAVRWDEVARELSRSRSPGRLPRLRCGSLSESVSPSRPARAPRGAG